MNPRKGIRWLVVGLMAGLLLWVATVNAQQVRPPSETQILKMKVGEKQIMNNPQIKRLVSDNTSIVQVGTDRASKSFTLEARKVGVAGVVMTLDVSGNNTVKTEVKMRVIVKR